MSQRELPDIELLWPEGPREPRPVGQVADLSHGEVHLWSSLLDISEEAVEACVGTLSEDERQRAEQFRTGPLRTRFIAARATLRRLLGRYLDEGPGRLRFVYGPRGKPSLAPPWNGSLLEFNVSHCQGLALYGFALDRELGIDVERIDPRRNIEGLVERYFSPEEIAAWRGLPAGARPAAFFLGWTRKEAWLKAIGTGLSFPLDQISVSLVPGGPARVLSIQGSAAAGHQWWLDSSEPAGGCVAAVAMRGEPGAIRRWRWE